jgi:hypothetical protein
MRAVAWSSSNTLRASLIFGIHNVEDVATCINVYDQTDYPERSPWGFTGFYVPRAFDASPCEVRARGVRDIVKLPLTISIIENGLSPVLQRSSE